MRGLFASLIILSAATCAAAPPDRYQESRIDFSYYGPGYEFNWGANPGFSGVAAEGFVGPIGVTGLAFFVYQSGDDWWVAYGDVGTPTPDLNNFIWTATPWDQSFWTGYATTIDGGEVPAEWVTGELTELPPEETADYAEVVERLDTLVQLAHVGLVVGGGLAGGMSLAFILYALTRREIL